MVFRSQELGTRCAHCCWGFAPPWTSQRTELGRSVLLFLFLHVKTVSFHTYHQFSSNTTRFIHSSYLLLHIITSLWEWNSCHSLFSIYLFDKAPVCNLSFVAAIAPLHRCPHHFTYSGPPAPLYWYSPIRSPHSTQTLTTPLGHHHPPFIHVTSFRLGPCICYTGHWNSHYPLSTDATLFGLS